MTQLDLIELTLLRRFSVIDAEVLDHMMEEVGSGLDERTRRFMPILIVGVALIAIVLIVQFIDHVIQGDVLRIFGARNIALANVWLLLLAIWTRAKQTRFGRIRRVMLKYRRCPHCGYDLNGLAPDESDGYTICPECGCAWRVSAS